MGWTGTGLNSKSMAVTIKKGSVGNRTYIANWEVKQFVITWVINDVSTNETVDYGSVIEYKEETPVKERTPEFTYTFIGWFDINNEELVEGSFVTENQIFIAKNLEEGISKMNQIIDNNSVVLLENDLPDNYL